jgi:hypothetical protein
LPRIIHLSRKFVLQDHKCFRLACGYYPKVNSAQTPTHDEFLKERNAVRGDIRFGTTLKKDMLSRPNNRLISLGLRLKPSTSPFLFQPGFSAVVALPTGLVGELKMEGDD